MRSAAEIEWALVVIAVDAAEGILVWIISNAEVNVAEPGTPALVALDAYLRTCAFERVGVSYREQPALRVGLRFMHTLPMLISVAT